MLISCNICRDKIISTHEVIITANCGHLYHKSCFEPWIKANPTCPTCRSKQGKKAIKVFFTTEDDVSECPDAVIERLEEQSESIRVKNETMEKELTTVREENRLCSERLASLENEVFAKTAKLTQLSAAAKSFKAEVKRLTEENNELRHSVRENSTLQRLKIILDGTRDEVAQMLQNTSCDNHSFQTLCTFVAQLKKCNLREKEKIQELRQTKYELLDQVKDLKRRIEDLKSGSNFDNENSSPLRFDPKPVASQSSEYIDLDEPYETSVAFGANKPLKVLDQRKFERRQEVALFSKSKIPFHKNNSQSSSFEYDGMGGSKRVWPFDATSKPYQRPTHPVKKQKSKLKGQQPSLENYLILD